LSRTAEPHDRKSGTEDSQGADSRTPFQRDRDRILYSTAFRRLANVTQVVGPLEGHVFHNRLTHSLEVAQIARRLAESLNRQPDRVTLIDADLVEAAAMAHDLGHPPFGHVAETKLAELAKAHGCTDGFEGNAQSFRILVRLAELNVKSPRGLDLTRGVLNAVLKYPWSAARARRKKLHKFNVYDDDLEDFRFAREGGPLGQAQCIEAQIMDLADDIAYSVHDVDDLFRAGLLPLNELAKNSGVWDGFAKKWRDDEPDAPLTASQQAEFRNLANLVLLGANYTGVRSERAQLRTFVSDQITSFTSEVALRKNRKGQIALHLPPSRRDEIAFLKRIVWHFVIQNPRLASAQEGQRRVIQALFDTYFSALAREEYRLIPPLFADDATEVGIVKVKKPKANPKATRLVIDIVASFSDDQAMAMYRRLMGSDDGRLHAFASL
jgi:dGTPase